MNTEKLVSFFEENEFLVHLVTQENIQCAEVEKWTSGGVDMNIWLNPFTAEAFHSFVKDFDIDQEIEINRQDKSYRANFTIRQSLEDFEEFQKMLIDVSKQLKELEDDE